MASIKIKKGHDIRISGVPAKEVDVAPRPRTVALHPVEFRYIKPKLLVNEGTAVKIGSPLFFDKQDERLIWASPGGGKVSKIQFGHRRCIEEIVIELDKDEEIVEHPVFDHEQIAALSMDQVTAYILNAGLWPLIRQRPFNSIAHYQHAPESIFVSCYNSAPLTVDLDVALRNRRSSFQAGITALSRLTAGSVHVVVSIDSVSETFMDIPTAQIHTISGPHPAGNVGIQIHHIDPLKPGKTIWTVGAQHVVTLGRLFLKGTFDPHIIMTVGGPSVKQPMHLKTRMGTSVKSLLDGRMDKGSKRIVSGDVLMGTTTNLDKYVQYYDTSLAVIPHSDEREFLGMLRPGSTATRYSLTKAFLSGGRSLFPFTTKKNGEDRALVPINAWENVLPMDIFPNPLYRAILANDIEEMEALGLLECDEEDFALCSFACPSKTDVGAVIRQGLDLLKAES